MDNDRCLQWFMQPSSAVHRLANNPENPNVAAAVTLFGYACVSEDSGDTPGKLQKEFGEIRALAAPN